MISVSININGNPAIFARTAVNQGLDKEGRMGISTDSHHYLLDDGSWIKHRPVDGAVVLAIKMLQTIKEQVKENM